jgi:hypothetical protein
VIDGAQELLRRAGVRAPSTVLPVSGGANNRVFRVEAGGQSYLLKQYFRDADDSRDRATSEWRFCRFAWTNGVRSLPQPFGCDAQRQLGLYEFVVGAPLVAVDAAALAAALEFVKALNALRDEAEASRLPLGAEAGFSVAAHVGCVERRLARLTAVPADGALGEELHRFVGEIAMVWDALRAGLSGQLGDRFEEVIGGSERVLSPSDFGFHNALRRADGRLCFIDFEYAGWDDPAKLVGDFFGQVAVPVAAEWYEEFASAVAALCASPREARKRMDLLRPVYMLKWVLILLNEFLPDSGRRRMFAGRAPTPERQAEQLEKARAAFQRISGPGANPLTAR